ncbi:DUF3019 domain-containing protein [Microbulbifer magnicolonia]|uniref:DUF3019 domain-containing protein n=1 Tax=Microbulbifer magnicolonia TaxID=3109744 RepID=UPI002B40C18C|nr:DUF3019 domain-containing protein [Microbulbifer sp. GG15]
MKTRLSCLLLALCVSNAGNAAELRVTPSLCAINDDDSRCDIPVKVLFSSDDPARFCLSISGRGLIRCFDGGAARELQLYVSAEEDVLFRVTEEVSGKDVATASLKVARYRPKRHRRHYGWGLL